MSSTCTCIHLPLFNQNLFSKGALAKTAAQTRQLRRESRGRAHFQIMLQSVHQLAKHEKHYVKCLRILQHL